MLCPSAGAKIMQMRAMSNYEFKFKSGTEVAARMTPFGNYFEVH